MNNDKVIPTAKGEAALVVLESGDGVMPELDQPSKGGGRAVFRGIKG